MSEVVRVVLDETDKELYKAYCKQNGQTMSEHTRQLIYKEIGKGDSKLARLNSILDSADNHSKASGLNTPSIEEIDQYIAEVREERISKAMAV